MRRDVDRVRDRRVSGNENILQERERQVSVSAANAEGSVCSRYQCNGWVSIMSSH